VRFLGELVLAALIMWGCATALKHMMSGAAARMPAPARTRAVKAGQAGKKATRVVVEPVRNIRARARAEARATHWLDGKRAARERREKRRDIRRENRLAAGPRRLRLPKVAVHVPGVTDKQPTLKAVPAATTSAPGLAHPPSPPRPVPAPSHPAPERQPAMAPSVRNSVTPDHAAVNARIAQFEPESDGDLIRFMSAEASGVAMYAQALEQLSEHLLQGVGLDPAAVQGVHEYAQAMTEAALLMTQANARFQAVYQGVRETVAGGVVLPWKGRFMTGESA
jgi:hypothetical protein